MCYPGDELFPPQPGGRQTVPRVGDAGGDPCGAAGRLQLTSDASLEPGAVVRLNRAQEQGKAGWWPDPDLGQGETAPARAGGDLEVAPAGLEGAGMGAEERRALRGDGFILLVLGFLPITPRSLVLFHHTHPTPPPPPSLRLF